MLKEKIKTIEPFDMTNDALFKSVFRSINARGVVIDFLSAITGIEKERLEKAKISGGELTKTKTTEKSKTSDIMVELSFEERIIVEINGSYDKNQFTKNTEYAFSVKVETTKSKKKYSKVFLINIDNYNKFNTKEPLLHFKLRDEFGHIENESYNSIHLVLENIVNNKYNKDVDERIVSFAKFIKSTTLNEMQEKFKGDENYMSAIRTVEELSIDPEFIGYYDVEEARIQDLEDAKETGIELGIEQGIKRDKIEIAKNMLKENESLEKISLYTNLKVSEIEILKKDNNDSKKV